jgi:hypothetical protein
MMAAPVKTRTIIDVEIVDPGGSDSDQNLAGFRLWRRKFLVTEHVRAAELMYADCSHRSSQATRKSLIGFVPLILLPSTYCRCRSPLVDLSRAFSKAF